MKASQAIKSISRDAQKQIFIQELLSKGITATQDGTTIQDLDYYALRSEVMMARFREIDACNSENRWF